MPPPEGTRRDLDGSQVPERQHCVRRSLQSRPFSVASTHRAQGDEPGGQAPDDGCDKDRNRNLGRIRAGHHHRGGDTGQCDGHPEDGNRDPEGGIDPEAELVANHDFWGKMGRAERMSLQMRVGTEPGNTVWFLAPSVQYTGLTYQDRNGIRTYDAQLKFSRVLGNDEFAILLM